ncbi:MAG: hypothetical protein HY537_18345, partial [Deltaproteobacteria bacterium]|nr:hypothetical protein [Deltaproteobacteria bacterium]
LYPFPAKEIKEAIDCYRHCKKLYWVQEEPKNMGAWHFVEPRFRELFTDGYLQYCGRHESASPATGWHRIHEKEEKVFLEEALRE